VPWAAVTAPGTGGPALYDRLIVLLRGSATPGGGAASSLLVHASCGRRSPPPRHPHPHRRGRPIVVTVRLTGGLAAERGVSISAKLRDLIAAGLEATTGASPDPVTELRRSPDAARELTADRHRDAA
jgi:hypothetical protein